MGSGRSRTSPQGGAPRSNVRDLPVSANDSQRSLLKRRLREISTAPITDITKATSLVDTNDDFLDSFRILLDAMERLVLEDKAAILEGLRNIRPLFTPYGDDVKIFTWMGTCGDFFALIGGAERTVDIYTETLPDCGPTHMAGNFRGLKRIAKEGKDTQENRKRKREKKGKRKIKEDQDVIMEITEDVSESNQRADKGDTTGTLSRNTVELQTSARSSGWGQTEESSQALVFELQNLWLGITDTSLLFSSRLADAGLLEHFVDFLAEPRQNPYLDDASHLQMCVFILHNCAKNPHIRQHLRDLNTADILWPYLDGVDRDLKLVILLTLSYVMEETDSSSNSLQANYDEVVFLLDGIDAASRSKLHLFENWHLYELLQGIMNLAKNDDYKMLLVQMDALRLLKPVIKDGQETEKLIAMKTVWQLAFAEENKNTIKGDVELMKLVRDVKKAYPADSEMSKCAQGILFVLGVESITKSNKSGERRDVRMRDSVEQEGVGAKRNCGHVMISYQHFSKDTLTKVCKYLRQRRYRVWMDVDSISGHSSTLEAMAKAVEDAEAVLFCMSEHYKDSANCRLEAEYAFDKGKVMIPMLMQKGYKPDGWLGILKGSKLFIDFSGKYAFEDQMEKLIAELGTRGKEKGTEDVDGRLFHESSKTTTSTPIPPNATKTSARSKSTVDLWSESDVALWLTSYHLQGCQQLHSLSGENLVCLQKLRKEVPEFFFNFLKQDLGLSCFDLLHFSDAVDKLPTLMDTSDTYSISTSNFCKKELFLTLWR